MKNFTNNFKQFTSRLSARWLIMALMMLVGISSAWGKTLYLNPKWDNDTWDKDGAWFQAWAWKSGENGNWYTAYSVDKGYYAFDIPDNTTHVKLYRKAKDGASNDHNKGNWGSTGDIELGSNDLCKMRDYSNVNLYSTTKSYELSGGFSSNNNWQSTDFPSNISIQANNTPYEFKVKEIVKYNDNGDKTFEVWLSNTGTMDRNNHEGWRMYADVSQNCKITADVSGTYTFTFDATTKKLSVEYPSACSTPELSDFTYTLPDDDNTKAGNEVMWNGNTHAATVKWKDEDSTEGITIYYKNGDVYSEEAPSAVGEYEVYITTTENNDFCALTTKTKVGTFTITCPTPAESPIYSVTQQTTSCKGTDNEIGKITLTNYNDAYTYQLNGKAVTVTNDQITGLAAGNYTISAAKTCGSAQSESQSGTSVDITSTDLTPTIAGGIVILGNNNICSGGTTELTCNVEPSEGTIDSYSWNPTGTQNDNKLITESLDANTNYVATVTITNDGCSKDFSSAPYQVTVNPVPSKPSFVTDGEVTCAEKPVNPNLGKELASGEYLVWYDASEGGTNLGSNLTSSAEDVTKIYYAAVSNGACESAERTPYTVDVEADPIVDLTLTLVDGKGNSLPLNYTYCQGDDVNVKLTYNGGIYWGEPEWNSTLTAGDMNTSGLRYDALNKKGEGTYTISNLQASGTLQVALTMCGDTKATSNVLNVNITPQAETPTVEVLLNIEKCGNDITQYGKIQISPYNAGYTYKINDTDVTPNNNGIVENLSTAGSFTLSAINSCKVSTPSAPFTISETDNKPTISISGSEKAVLYEDVMLTAIATQGATVKWYEGGVEKATGATYVVTSETATSKDVTAKAFLNGCESEGVNHPVTFTNEDCEDKETSIQISKTKITSTTKPSGWTNLYCYAWIDGGSIITESWPGTKMEQDGSNYYIVLDIDINNTKKFKLKFNDGRTINDNPNQSNSDSDGYKGGYEYSASDISSKPKLSQGNAYTDSETTTIPATITAPAVKIESVTTTTGLGDINFTGRVVKKGCDDTNEYGFQYSTDRQNWTTVKVGENASAGTPFSDNSVKGLDGTYYIRAYITNDHSTQTSAEKEIRLQTSTDPISNVSIEFVAAPGENNVPSAYCVGSTAYIKATYDGAKYTQFEWKSDQGITLTELGSIPDVFQFTVKGNDNIVLMLRNIYNREGEFFSNDPPLVVNATPEPTAPTISLDKSTLCSNDDEGATISLANTVVGQTYSLFKEIENGDDTQIGDDIVCTEQNKESISFNLKGLDVAGRYYVIAKENVCNRTIGTTSVTLEVVNTTGLSISIEPNTAVVTPWEPVKLKITATEGYQYNVTGLDGMVYTVNGDTYTVKIPLPEGGTSLDTDDNVIFEGIDYRISATLITGGDNQCINPAICTITLTPYLEPCTQN